MKAICIPIFSALLLSACGNQFNTELHTVELDKNFTVDLPKGLHPLDSLHDFASLQYGNDQIGLYAIGIRETKEEVKSVNLTYSAREYAHFVLRNLISGMDSVENEFSTEFTIGQMDCFLTDVTGIMSNAGIPHNMTAKVAVFESASHFYQLMIWSGAKEMTEMAPLVDQIVCSVREIPADLQTTPPDLPSGESSQLGMK